MSFSALYSHTHICFVHAKDKISILGLRVFLSELMFVYSSFDGSGDLMCSDRQLKLTLGFGKVEYLLSVRKEVC